MPTEQGSVYLAAPDTPIPATVDTPSDWKPLHTGSAETDFYVDDEHPSHIWLNAHEYEGRRENVPGGRLDR